MMVRTPLTHVHSLQRQLVGTTSVLTMLTLAACSGTLGEQAGEATYTHVVPSALMNEWDPAQMYTREPTAMRNVYETLTYYDSENEEVQPLLATDWESSEDGLDWMFQLRDDVTFHSGEPLTAEAVAESIERTMAVDGGAAYLWDAVAEIDAADEHTLSFELDYPAPLDLVTSAAYGAFIYEVPDDASSEPAEEDPDSPFYGEGWGTGPYTVAEFQPGEEFELTLDQHGGYWRDWDDDQFEHLEFQVVAEEATAAQLVESGEADGVQGLPNELLESVSGHDDVQILETTSMQNVFAFLNTESGPLADESLRQALVHSIDYNAIIEASEGDLVESSGIVPPGPFGAETDVEAPQYDPDLAEELFEEAGYDMDNDIVELEFTYNEGEPIQHTAAELIQSQLADINIEVELIGLPQPTQLDRGRDADPEERQDLYGGNWWPDNAEANGWYSALYESEPTDEVFFNFSYYDNPDIDEDIAEVGELSATDREAAEELYAEMEEEIIADASSLLLGDVVYRRAIRDDVEGYVDNPLHPHTVFGYELWQG